MIETSALSTVLHAITAQATKAPGALAVCAKSEVLTYDELEQRAGRLAAHLRSVGVARDSVVAVCMPRSVDMAVGMLAIWKAGGAYLPMDPSNPPDRLISILEDAQVHTVLSSASMAQRLGKTGRHFVDVSRVAATSGTSTEIEPEPGDLAYVIYTSGSTGLPKGVEITHGSLANLVPWHLQAFDVTERDRASHMAGLGFDAAGWELWPYLAAGASVHFVDDVIRTTPDLLRDWMLAEQISIGFVPTPLAERLLSLPWPRETPLRILLTGGDTLHRYPPAGLPFALVNNYGPTECTVVATSAIVSPQRDSSALPPIGRAISNTEIHILDENLQPVPPGSSGEICIAGASLARGYRNLPNVTAEKFVQNPLAGPGGRIYRTGDVGRFLEDGQIEYLGRLDDQIKIRGYRIEPNEIISRLNEHPEIRESLALACDTPAGEKRLVAYIVPASGVNPADAVLIDFLREVLPDYMIPSLFMRLDAFPVTPNGKIDRDVLPPPNFAGSHAAEAPLTPVEQTLSAILANLLNVPGVGRSDNFFLLGGHSLLGAQLIAKIRKAFNVEISLRALFEAPTIAALAAEVQQRAAHGEAHASAAN